MGNTSKGKGTKGSKFWIQTLVNTPELKNELDQQVNDELIWLSPLETEEYAEYKLNQKTLIGKIGVDLPGDYFNFWPVNQPQWDGIALSSDNNILYIVEAKAHIKEMESKLSATNSESRKKINDSMKEVHDKYFSVGKFSSWNNKYYQLGNRLTFLKKMNESLPRGITKVKLLLLNFADDMEFINVTIPEWDNHYFEVWKEMTGRNQAPEDVIVINFSVKNRVVKSITKNDEIIRKEYRIDFNKVDYKNVYKDISLSNAEEYADFILKNIQEFKNVENFNISMRDSYVIDNESHPVDFDFKNIPRNSKGKIVREEEWICKQMLGKELNGIGRIVDYQVPLKCPGSLKNKGLGKVDLLSVSSDRAYLLEVKVEESNEHPLRAIMEAHTYWMHLGGDNAIEFINKSKAIGANKLKKGIVVYGTDKSQIYHTFKSSIKTQQIMKTLDVEMFLVHSIGELEFEILEEDL